MSQSSPGKAEAVPQADLRVSEDMKQQLKAIASAKGRGDETRAAHLRIVSFDSDLERIVPDPVVMWDKSSCC